MNDRHVWIGISAMVAGLAALMIFAGFQYSKALELSGNLSAQSAAVDALWRSDALKQRQLAAYAEENAALRKQLDEAGNRQKSELDALKATLQPALDDLRTKHRERVDEIRSRQTAEETRTNTINLSTIPGSHGQNIFVGTGAGPRGETAPSRDGGGLDTGSFNTALGTSSLGRNRTGAWNAALGTAALGLNEEGSNNLAAGANALGSNDAGSANVAVGSAAMYRNRTGAHNSAVGMQALYNLESGDNNSAFGRDSLFTTRQGSWNSAFGVDSLPGLEIGQGNSAFGAEAGYTEDRTYQHRLGSFNSWFGYQSGPATLRQVSNSIAIGYRAKNTDSNQTVIGNKETNETILFGTVKIDRLCVGTTCADAQSFAAMLQARRGR